MTTIYVANCRWQIVYTIHFWYNIVTKLICTTLTTTNCMNFAHIQIHTCTKNTADLHLLSFLVLAVWFSVWFVIYILCCCTIRSHCQFILFHMCYDLCMCVCLNAQCHVSHLQNLFSMHFTTIKSIIYFIIWNVALYFNIYLN